MVYPNSDEKDEEYCSLPPLLSCFLTPQTCATFNFVHHNSNKEVDIDNMTLEEYARYEEDSDQEDGELPDLPTFSDTNEFASVCEQVEENIDVNTARELEEVKV
uniref:Uncharacterized protein n=1 Tax=Tanacetum cinerariifolium TaxID=118510 RepID=A0A6L2JH87_TANCI|nr:hypothetical protein [Tanacetum cinerariifolium]